MIRKYQQADSNRVQEIALKGFDYNIRKEKKLFLARFMMKSYFKKKNIEIRLTNKCELFVFDNGSVDGFIEIIDNKEISNIFVDPDKQGQGIGKKLMEYAIARCFKENSLLTHIELDASKDAIAFYQKIGFILVEKKKVLLGVDMYPMIYKRDS